MCHTRRERGGTCPVSRHRGVDRQLVVSHMHIDPRPRVASWWCPWYPRRAWSSRRALPDAPRTAAGSRARSPRRVSRRARHRRPRTISRSTRPVRAPSFHVKSEGSLSRRVPGSGRAAAAHHCRWRGRAVHYFGRTDDGRAAQTVGPSSHRARGACRQIARAARRRLGGFSGVHASRWGGAMQACTARMAPAQADIPPRAAVPATCPPARARAGRAPRRAIPPHALDSAACTRRIRQPGGRLRYLGRGGWWRGPRAMGQVWVAALRAYARRQIKQPSGYPHQSIQPKCKRLLSI